MSKRDLISDKTLQKSLKRKAIVLGGLYSANDDTYFSGISLWSSEDIKSNTEVFMQPNSQTGLKINDRKLAPLMYL